MDLNQQFNGLTKEYLADIMESFKNQHSIEPHLNLVPSVIFKEQRCRPIWNKLHLRPAYETFHEFIIYILKATFGEDWRKEQMSLSESEKTYSYSMG